MIIDLQRFLTAERPTWAELERLLIRLEAEPNAQFKMRTPVQDPNPEIRRPKAERNPKS